MEEQPLQSDMLVQPPQRNSITLDLDGQLANQVILEATEKTATVEPGSVEVVSPVVNRNNS